MYSLHSCQSAFCDALLTGSGEMLQPMLLESEPVARRRLDAYRNNVIGTLSAALQSAYPVVARIVGMPFFLEAARQYILATPSESGDLNEFGAAFGDFLAGYPHAANLGYLPDVARLEWLVQAVFYAPDPPPADLGILATMDQDRYGDLRFSASPAHARIDSAWPLGDIWRVNQPDFDGDMAVDFSHGARLLVIRRNGLVHVDMLDAGEAALLDALARGETLADATARSTDVDPDIDLAAALRKLIGHGVLCHARLADATAG